MKRVVRISKRLIPIEEIVLVEPFILSAEGSFQSSKDFKGRIILVDGDSLLSEMAPEDFVARHGFRLIAEDRVALNPAVRFGVETFETTEGFQPQKAYRTRLLWKDWKGTPCSKLLTASPENVLAVVGRMRAGARGRGGAKSPQTGYFSN